MLNLEYLGVDVANIDVGGEGVARVKGALVHLFVLIYREDLRGVCLRGVKGEVSLLLCFVALGPLLLDPVERGDDVLVMQSYWRWVDYPFVQ